MTEKVTSGASLNFSALTVRAARAVPARAAIVQGERRLVYGELADRVDALALALARRVPGTAPAAPHQPWQCAMPRIGVVLRNRPEYLEVLLASSPAGLVPFNVNYRYGPDEMAALFGDARPSMLIYEPGVGPVISDALAVLPENATASITLVEVSDATEADGALSYESLVEEGRTTLWTAPRRPDPDDVTILYTGGTTGAPKGVLWRHEDLIARALGGRRGNGTFISEPDEFLEMAMRGEGQRTLPLAPFMHGTAQWHGLRTLLLGGTVVLPEAVDTFNAEEAVDLCRQHRVERLVIVGDAFARPLLDASRRSAPIDDVGLIISSGTALSNDVIYGLQGSFPNAEILDVLGTSETGRLATRRIPGGATPAADQRMTLVPGAGVLTDAGRFVTRAPVGDVVDGFLATRGNLPGGYLDDPDKTAETYREIDGERVAVPGDRVRLHPDQTLELIGRGSRVINTGGEKVYAEEVETVLLRHPSVAAAAVVGVEDSRWGQSIAAMIESDPKAAAADADELRTHCRGHLARYKTPRLIIFCSPLPRHANGKTDYGTVAAHLNEERTS